MGVHYHELAPVAALAPFVRCYWSLQAAAGELGGSPERILPDGCVELVFNAESPFERVRPASAVEIQPRTMVVGPTTRFIEIRPTCAVRLAGIRFRHAGTIPFLRTGLSELTDLTPELDALDGQGWRDLECRLADHSDPLRVASTIDRFLLRILNSWRGDVLRVQHATRRALSSGGMISVEAMARETNLGTRQLERVFREAVGVSPRTLLRLARFQRVLRAIENEARPRWAAVAATCGYYDQAHLVREFHAFAGLTPGAFVAQRHPLTEVFIADWERA